MDEVVKMDFMVKRSQMKGRLLVHENYKSRWFKLTKHFLFYCDGKLEVRKICIFISSVDVDSKHKQKQWNIKQNWNFEYLTIINSSLTNRPNINNFKTKKVLLKEINFNPYNFVFRTAFEVGLVSLTTLSVVHQKSCFVFSLAVARSKVRFH